MSRLFLRFAASADAVEWLACADGEEGEGATVEGCTPVDELADALAELAPWAANAGDVVVFVPAAELLALSCEIPGRSETQRRRAAPYAVEEFLTEDIETMHVACGELVRNEPVRCLVIPRARVQSYLTLLESAGIAPAFMTADAMALPVAPASANVLFDGDVALVRTDNQIASVDVPNLAAALEAVRMDFDEEEQPLLRQINGKLSEIELTAAGFAAGHVESLPLEGSLLGFLASAFDAANAINLLQGDFAARRRTHAAWAPWRPVAVTTGVGLAIAVVVLVAEGFWATQRANALREDAQALYRDIYGVAQAPANPALRMRMRLGGAPAETVGFHRLVGNLGTSLQQLAGRYELRSLSYSERIGLGAEVIVPDYDSLEKIEVALAERTVDLDVVSAELFEERVRTNLRINDGRG